MPACRSTAASFAEVVIEGTIRDPETRGYKLSFTQLPSLRTQPQKGATQWERTEAAYRENVHKTSGPNGQTRDKSVHTSSARAQLREQLPPAQITNPREATCSAIPVWTSGTTQGHAPTYPSDCDPQHRQQHGHDLGERRLLVELSLRMSLAAVV